jgi:hypothetical protein
MVTRRRDGYRCAPPILRAGVGIAGSPKSGRALSLQQGPRTTSEIQKFRLPTDPNQFTDSRRPVPQRGVRTSRTRGGMRWTLAARETNAACWRTAKSCRSGAPMQASSLADFPRGDGVKQAWSRGEREVSRKTIARGMPGQIRCDRGDYARVFAFYHTRGCGCIGHPAFPAPSVFSGRMDFIKKLGRIAPRDREAMVCTCG